MPKKYKREIIKIQKPIVTNGPAEAMVYNEDHSVFTLLPWTEDLDEIFGDDLKQYWLADIPQFDKGFIKLIQEVEEQVW